MLECISNICESFWLGNIAVRKMKIEDLILAAMNDDNSGFVQDSRKRSNDSDEGCYTFTDASSSMRRVKSTSNLLEIPTPHRSRKKSDDSAVGSAEESELSEASSSGDVHQEQLPLEAESMSSKEPEMETLMTAEGRLILRPPSVVVSDHDLYPDGEKYITLDELDAEFDKGQLMRRRISDCSTCSSLSFSDTEYVLGTQQVETEEEEVEYIDGKKVSRWRTIRTIVHQLTPFIQTYKRQRYPWVQLAGHQGHFKGGEQGTILKKFCEREKEAFVQLMNDSLRPFVPQYYGTYSDDTESDYIQIEDLLGRFQNPCVMDCKIGVRTYLEDELMKAKVNQSYRKDMYEKMAKIDKNAPTPEEHLRKGVTKPRYMVWRETISTTSTFGFRIEGMRKSDGFSSKDFKTTKTEEQVKEAFSSYVKGFSRAIPLYIERLKALKAALAESEFFTTHEVIGSSLLFVHDDTSASIWMIDFAKTCLIPPDIPPITHEKSWCVGNHEDGYLTGLHNLIKLFEELKNQPESP